MTPESIRSATKENVFLLRNCSIPLTVESPAYELIGIAGLNIDPYCHCANYGRVRRMYVSPPHRRRGVARALIEEIERTAKENFSRLQLFTNSADASSFYQSLGFQQVNNETKVSHVKILSA